MTMQKATMTQEWRAEVTWAVNRVYRREGEAVALRLLAVVGEVYGADEEERMGYAVFSGLVPEKAR